MAAVAWWLLAAWSPGAAERIYLLVPPIVLSLYAMLSEHGWRGLRRYCGVALVAFALLASSYVFYHLRVMSLPAPDGSGRVFRGLSVWEAVVTLYFLGSLLLVLWVAYRGLRGLCRGGDELLFGSSAEAQKEWPRRRAFLRKVLPVLLCVPVFVPYLASVMYIHRLKLPNPATPRELIGREYEEVAFATDDGLTLRGWFMPARQATGRTLLICHGLGINRAHVLGYHALGDALRANLFVFDFRGHGDSDGHTVSLGCREKLDVLAAVRYLRHVRPEQSRAVVGLGISMGSAALTRAAAELDVPLEAVILDSGFAGVGELTDSVFEQLPGWLRPWVAVPGLALASLHAGCDLAGNRPVEQIAALRAPVLIIHARGDRLVPAAHAAQLFEQASLPKALWLTDTGDHCSAWDDRAEYQARVARLLQ